VIGDSYKSLEKRVQAAVHLRFGLPARLPEEWTLAIKRADREAAYIEAVALAGFTETEARKIFAFRRKPHATTLTALPAEDARERFLAKFAKLA